jgi:hypothetical protein
MAHIVIACQYAGRASKRRPKKWSETSKEKRFSAIAGKSQLQLPVKLTRHSTRRSDRIRPLLNTSLKKSPRARTPGVSPS